jgi:sRNA-binding carbon storage regulator CsrA
VLIVSMKDRESVVVEGSNGVERLLKVTVLDSHSGSVRLGLEAGDDCSVHRWQGWEHIDAGLPPDREMACSAIPDDELGRSDSEGGGIIQ